MQLQEFSFVNFKPKSEDTRYRKGVVITSFDGVPSIRDCSEAANQYNITDCDIDSTLGLADMLSRDQMIDFLKGGLSHLDNDTLVAIANNYCPKVVYANVFDAESDNPQFVLVKKCAQEPMEFRGSITKQDGQAFSIMFGTESRQLFLQDQSTLEYSAITSQDLAAFFG